MLFVQWAVSGICIGLGLILFVGGIDSFFSNKNKGSARISPPEPWPDPPEEEHFSTLEERTSDE